MALINEENRTQLQPILENLDSNVNILFFTQENACPTCQQQQQLLEELSSLSNKLTLKTHKFLEEREIVRKFGIDKIPATVVMTEEDYGIRYYGLTLGYEFSSLIQTVFMVSTGQTGLDPQLEDLIKAIDKPAEIQVMATLTCPYCPLMVRVAHQFAMANPRIKGDMVDVSEFPHLAQRYNVTGVPKTIINETHSFEGAIQPEAVYLEVLKAVNPETYRQIEESIQRHLTSGGMDPAQPDEEYDVVVVGGGPAGLSASLYAARKGLNVALIAEKLGGQLNYTAMIDNYLGLPGISGVEMTEIYRKHVEKQSVKASLGEKVIEVQRRGRSIQVITDESKRFSALSVIYCAGMEYRRLGVPGEERFIGRGIGFCATCDAPLFQGKAVAVVGGGNSAFTALRDLLMYASDIHLIHRSDEFTADYELIKEVLASDVASIHKPMIVKSFRGMDKLTGIRLESTDGVDRFDLKVDGVFLEIGLDPNSAPLKNLLELNEDGEVPVTEGGSTNVEGIFAAGDVTDIGEKQIAIAVGQGATAALTAYKYLVENKLIDHRKSVDGW